jgi:hypothetical protein
MTDVTNVFNNKKIAIVKDNKIIDCVLIHPDDVETILPNVIEKHQADESIEIAGELSWLGVGCVKDNGVWRPTKTFTGWVWGENGWEAPTPKPEGNYAWNNDSAQWVIIPE